MRAVTSLFLMIIIGAAAMAQVPSSSRSEAAINRVKSQLQNDLNDQNLQFGAPIFIQITKIPAELKVYVQAGDGQYRLFRTYPICTYSGGLGPKKRQGDGKSPEGFYRIRPNQMNPSSSYHLSFNLGYPNAYDRSKGYTGDYLMVHGRCASIGCYAMTDPVIEEIWTLMDAAFRGGQREVLVHIFPYRMNWPMRIVPQSHSDHAFWQSLAPAWTGFTETGKPPQVSVAGGQYIITPARP